MKNTKKDMFQKRLNGKKLIVTFNGRLDTTTAPELEKQIRESLDGVEKLVFDFKTVDQVSSAGLRVLSSTQKIMTKQGEMVIKNASDEVMDFFEETGFSEILNIEETR